MMIFKIRQEYHVVNYKHVYDIANEFLAASHSINAFPFKAKEFVEEQSDIKLCSFSKAIQHGVDMKKFGSESAIITEHMGRHIIFYNKAEPIYRVRFSIMHEFGHYILRHVSDLPKDDSLYQNQELEANCFAAQMLMPEQILRECLKRGKKLTLDFIQKSFDVSKEAAEKRIKHFRNSWRSVQEKELDDSILLKYETFLDQIAPKKFSYYDFEHDLEIQAERDSWSL